MRSANHAQIEKAGSVRIRHVLDDGAGTGDNQLPREKSLPAGRGMG